ncbi:MAG: preprotein translocase subunit SecE [Alphaproteobacteria bacterium]|nr:preprotein translocase subunit SecE [Alphaproteobacteria bacterium]MBV8548405.1 preprotein translocase subunit SecE [Alphaproteobacteria bacterium]
MADEQNKAEKAERKTSFADFVRETRQEIAKVTWPSQKETLMTTVAIVVMAVAAGVFFLAVDSVLGAVVSRILGMNS